MKYFPLFLLTLLFTFNAKAQTITPAPLKVSGGNVERIKNFPSAYIASRNVDIWLPESYSPNKKYAVVYMQDGQMLYDANTTWNHQEWKVDEVMGRLLKEDSIHKAIVVGIWNTENRHSDYFPQKPYQSLSKQVRDTIEKKENSLLKNGVDSDNYLKFMVKELKPFIDAHYSTKSNQENTFLIGSSMGGLISMYAICEYPGVYGGAACMSTHWIGTFSEKNNPIPRAFINYLRANLPDPETHKIYFDYGTETLDAMYGPTQKKVDAVMKEKGYSNNNWETLIFKGDDHSEKSWSGRLSIPLTFLLGK